MIKRILVGLGSMPFTSCEAWHAIELAKEHGAELTAMTVVDRDRLSMVGPVPLGGTGSARELEEYRIEQAEERVEEESKEFGSACANAGVRHTIKHETGDPFDLLSLHWRYHDLTILSLRNIFEHGVIEDPHDALVRLISEGVRPILAVSSEIKAVKRALITYDGSVPSANTMKWLVCSRPWKDVALRIVCFDKGVADPESLVAEAAAYCRAHAYEVTAEVVAGTAKESILGYADESNADVIALGNSTGGALMRTVFGSTTLHVIRNSHLPVLLSE